MPGKLLRAGLRLVPRSRPITCAARNSFAPIAGCIQSRSFSAVPGRQRDARPKLDASGHGSGAFFRFAQRRTIFIQTEATPNVDALKFLPNMEVKPSSIPASFIEYLTPRSTIAPPYTSPLASKLMDVDGVISVFYGPDFITVTKAADSNWQHIKPEVFALITETITRGETLVNVVKNSGSEGDQELAGSEVAGDVDSLAYDENDSEVVGMIKELLDTRIRPAIQEDGGDLEFCGFEGGQVMLRLRGACRTCDSSTVTLKESIERMLMHYIEDVEGVTQVLDKGEEVAIQEFAKFEEKLRNQKTSAMG